MSTFVWSNFFQTTLAAAVNASQTTITVGSSTNAPAISAGQQWPIVVQSQATPSSREVMYVTAISGTTFTVTRAQEGTGAGTWGIGDYVIGTNTAGAMESFGQLNAIQTWSGVNTFAANATFEQAVTVEGGFTVDGNATVEGITAFGTGGQFSINPNYAGTQLINFASGNYVQFSAGVGLQFVSSEEIQLSASSGVFTSTPPVNDSSTRVATTQFANPGSSIGSPGRILFPCGLIFQWGSGPAAANSATSIVYPLVFPTAVLMGQATWGGTAPVNLSPPTLNVHGVGSSTSQGYVYNDNGSTIYVDWLVIGY